MSDGVKLGQLLCDADIITKRQLSKALQAQVKGNKGTIGEILVEMGFCDFEDITDALMNSSTNTEKHEEKHEEIHKEPIEIKPEIKDIPSVKPKKEEPVELSEDKVMGTKFTMSVQTLVALVSVIAAGVGGYYMLLSEIEEAKQLPEPPSIESILVMSIHRNPMDTTGLVLMNNIKRRLVDCKKIWVMYSISLKNTMKRLKN